MESSLIGLLITWNRHLLACSLRGIVTDWLAHYAESSLIGLLITWNCHSLRGIVTYCLTAMVVSKLSALEFSRKVANLSYAPLENHPLATHREPSALDCWILEILSAGRSRTCRGHSRSQGIVMTIMSKTMMKLFHVMSKTTMTSRPSAVGTRVQQEARKPVEAILKVRATSVFHSFRKILIM